MSGKFKDFHIVCVYDDYGFDEGTFFPLRGVFLASNPDFWEFGNPGTLLAYFLSDKMGAARSHSLVENIGLLRRSSPAFSGCGCGTAHGQLVVDMTWFGKVKSAPLGIAANNAMRIAREQSHERAANK